MELDTSQKGRLGEIKVAVYYMELGYEVYVPNGGNTSCDLIVIDPKNGIPLRIEVKTTDSVNRHNNPVAFLGRVRKNNTTKIKTGFVSKNSDKLAIYSIALDKVFVFDSKEYEGVYTVVVK